MDHTEFSVTSRALAHTDTFPGASCAILFNTSGDASYTCSLTPSSCFFNTFKATRYPLTPSPMNPKTPGVMVFTIPSDNYKSIFFLRSKSQSINIGNRCTFGPAKSKQGWGRDDFLVGGSCSHMSLLWRRLSDGDI